MTPEPRISIVSIGLEPKPDTLVVVSADLRTYLGLARSGEYYHAIRPGRAEDPIVGDGKAVVGELVCSCAGGQFGQRCYWTKLAEALERGDRGFVLEPPDPADAEIPWMRGRVAAGAHV